MTEALELIARLEARIAEIEQKADFRWESIKKNMMVMDENLTKDSALGKRADEIAWAAIQRLEKWGKTIAEELEAFRRKAMRYDEAYYRVFPERLEQDVRVGEQFSDIVSKPAPGADSEKA